MPKRGIQSLRTHGWSSARLRVWVLIGILRRRVTHGRASEFQASPPSPGRVQEESQRDCVAGGGSSLKSTSPERLELEGPWAAVGSLKRERATNPNCISCFHEPRMNQSVLIICPFCFGGGAVPSTTPGPFFLWGVVFTDWGCFHPYHGADLSRFKAHPHDSHQHVKQGRLQVTLQAA